MKVYHPEGSSQTLMVAPAALMDATERPSDWLDHGGAPRRFDIKFESGVAEVDAKLGEWLIKQGHANKTSLRRVTRKLFH